MEEQNFSIQASAAAFETLSTKLYSEPILAVVRELSTNANDAHIEAGVERPFDLHIPTENEPYFKIRDYGNGLSQEEVFSIYTSFFMSTKKGDDSQTGYFGLGSKSPFAIVDSYTVISYNGGTKKTYEMSKHNGTPFVKKIDESKTDESGLEIYFDFSDRSYNEYCNFKDHSKNFFSSTTFLPNWNWKDLDIDFEAFLKDREFYTNESYKIGYAYRNTHFTLNIAGVGFELDFEKLLGEGYYKTDLMENLSNLMLRSVNLIVPKNAVTLTPSREELHYDEKTKKYLIHRVEEYAMNFVEGIWNKQNKNLKDYMFLASQSVNQTYKLFAENLITNNFVYCLEQKYDRSLSNRVSEIISVGSLEFEGYSNFYVIDFSEVHELEKSGKKAASVNVVKEVLEGKRFKQGKIDSPTFTSKLKNAIPDNTKNSIFLLPKSIDLDINDLEATFFSDLNHRIIKYSVSTAKKDDSEKRKVGFKNQRTLQVSLDGRYHPCGSFDPDIKDGEIGLLYEVGDSKDKIDFDNVANAFRTKLKRLKALILMSITDENEREAKAKEITEQKYFLKPCPRSVFLKYKNLGYKTIDEYFQENTPTVDSFEDLKDKFLKQKFLFYFTETLSFDQEVFDKINSIKYDEIADLDFVRDLRAAYTQEIIELKVPDSDLEDILRDCYRKEFRSDYFDGIEFFQKIKMYDIRCTKSQLFELLEILIIFQDKVRNYQNKARQAA